MSLKRGILIALEGIDRSGKSTQVNLIKKNLKNTELIRFPNRESATGKMIDLYLNGK